MSDKYGYTYDWVQIHRTIAFRADLVEIDSNVVHRNSIDEKCLKRKKKAIEALNGNVSKLSVYFGHTERSTEEIIEGRRMYRQYKGWIETLRSQVAVIESWLSVNPPF